jgi:phage-related protein/predicted XRE-type DNA-binding protein
MSIRKPLHFIGSSHRDLMLFPAEARRAAGFNLDSVQRGLEPEDWKPLMTVGSGVAELRLWAADGTYRIVYLATRPEGVYVLHCFEKKTRKTAKRDIDLATERLKAVLRNKGEPMKQRRTSSDTEVTHTTPGNRSVFYDLGFDEAEARVLEMRAELIAAIRSYVQEQGLNQTDAAKVLGISQPRVSALMKGSWREFSADMLLVLAGRVGLRPRLKLAA